MNINSFKEQYIDPYSQVNYIHDDRGWIAWRTGTGENIELLHIRTFKKRRGYGRQLFIEMLQQLVDDPPYFSVFGFTRVSNTEAQNFYEALGFNIEKVTGLYKDGECHIFWAPFSHLVQEHITL